MRRQKAYEARVEEALRIMRAVAPLGGCPEHARLRAVVRAFVERGEPSSGRIAFAGSKRVLEYALAAREGTPSTAVLRYREGT